MKMYKWFLSIEKEEAWLNTMAKNGYFLNYVSSLGCYTFDVAAPEDRIYRIDCRMFKKQSDLNDYITLFEDSGWNCAFSSMKICMHYFYSNQPDVNCDIFSDSASKAQRQLRLSKYLTSIYLACLLPYFVLFINGIISYKPVIYLTPGLWEMKGLRFIFAFLFETPFALLRSFSFSIPILIFIIPLIFYIKGKILYKKVC